MKDFEKMNKCDVVQDLMPSYVDGLASESTAKIIEEHVKECDACRNMLESMKADNGMTPQAAETDRKEIDFLRKSRKRGKRAVALGVILALVLAAAVAGAKLYLIGSEYNGDMACDFDITGSDMTVGATAADSMHVIRGMDFTMENGTVIGTARAVMPGIYHSSGTFSGYEADDENVAFNVVTCDWSGSFSFDEEIREVRIGDRVYWAGGNAISRKASDVFMAGHEYVGDAPENGALLSALEMAEDLGNLYSELETDNEPYVWRIILDEDQTKYDPAYLDKHLAGYGYVLLGSVSNLSEVEFRYTSGGETVTKKITLDDAKEFFGQDIKVCRSDAGALNELMEKAEIK